MKHDDASAPWRHRWDLGATPAGNSPWRNVASRAAVCLPGPAPPHRAVAAAAERPSGQRQLRCLLKAQHRARRAGPGLPVSPGHALRCHTPATSLRHGVYAPSSQASATASSCLVLCVDQTHSRCSQVPASRKQRACYLWHKNHIQITKHQVTRICHFLSLTKHFFSPLESKEGFFYQYSNLCRSTLPICPVLSDST